MSDGPHYSLELRKRWKKSAEVFDNPASTITERSNAISDALAADCKLEHLENAIEQAQDNLSSPQGSLLAETDMQEVRESFAGYELAERFADFTDLAISEGYTPNDSIEMGLCNALNERATKNARAMEEHYLKESNSARSNTLYNNAQEAISHTSFPTLAKEIINLPNRRYQNKHIKQTGIDVGVPHEFNPAFKAN